MRMVVIGDSVLWGQGLRPHQKIGRLLRQDLQEAGWPVAFDEERDFLAHSGAIIGEPGEHGDEAHADLDPEVAGEVPTDHPTLFEQLARIDDPHGVEVLVMDGGANDFGFLSLAWPFRSLDGLAERIGPAMERAPRLISRARSTCPNAIILYSGYYAGMSEHTQTSELNGALALGAMFTSIPVVGAALGSLLIRDRIVRNNYFWHHLQLASLRAAAAKAHADPALRGPGIAFVHPRFGPQNAVRPNARALRLYDAVPFVRSLTVPWRRDPMYGDRAEACRVHHPGMGGPAMSEDDLELILDELAEGRRELTADLLRSLSETVTHTSSLKCRLAASFHPLPEGAESYARAFSDAFERTARVSLAAFAGALSPQLGSVRSSIRRFGLDRERVGDAGAPTALSLRELSHHRRIDALEVTLESGGIRMTESGDRVSFHAARYRFRGGIVLDIGDRSFELERDEGRELPSSGNLTLPGERASFLIDPSFGVTPRTMDGQPLNLEDIEKLRLGVPGFATLPGLEPSEPDEYLEIRSIKVVLNGQIVVYDTTSDPDPNIAIDEQNPTWTAGEMGAPAFPLPERT